VEELNMRRWIGFAFVLSLLLSPVIGCGGGEGPADPDDTPEVSEDDIKKELEDTTPEQYKNHYQR